MIKIGTISPSLEDYLERVFDLLREEGVARVSDIAKRKSVRKASVNEAMGKLEKEGLVSRDYYGTIALTPEGAKLAKALEKRHGVLQRFFSEVLRVPPAIANQDACTVEHHIHPETVEGLSKFFDFLDHCPDGGNSWLRPFHDCCQIAPSDSSCSNCGLDHSPRNKEVRL